uniref:Uncharacterized protein n=1 Tax=Romanomermis culicivorax TaxID=13658 RepID=A0A915I869_ROMCU
MWSIRAAHTIYNFLLCGSSNAAAARCPRYRRRRRSCFRSRHPVAMVATVTLIAGQTRAIAAPQANGLGVTKRRDCDTIVRIFDASFAVTHVAVQTLAAILDAGGVGMTFGCNEGIAPSFLTSFPPNVVPCNIGKQIGPWLLNPSMH